MNSIYKTCNFELFSSSVKNSNLFAIISFMGKKQELCAVFFSRVGTLVL